MANTKKYLSHLLQNTGITPACSEEERSAADVIAKIFTEHGFTPEVQEFSASGMAKIAQAILGIAAFVGAVLMGIGGPAGIAGILVSLAAAIVFVLERSGKPIISALGSGGLSQNVIAYHKASGPLASPRNRPVVVVAHYDSPREDLLAREPFATYRPIIVKLLPFAMVLPPVIALVRMFPVPDAAKTVLWVIAILVALIPLVNGIAIIANRFVLPYTTGSVSNKSSVAAMLGVMDTVAPYELGEEFPRDVPADEYFAEQQRILEDAIAAAEAAAAAEAEAATSYPHEIEGQDEGDEQVEGDAAEPEAEQPTAFEVIDGTATAMPAIDPGATAMIPGEEPATSSTVVTEAVEVPAAPRADEATAAIDPGATVANMSVVDVTPSEAEVAGAAPVAEAELHAVVEGRVENSETAAVVARVDEPAEPVQVELDLDAAEPEPKLPFHVNGAGNIRFGSSVIRGLGMLPAACSVVYEAGDESEPIQPTAFEVEHAEETHDEGEYRAPAHEPEPEDEVDRADEVEPAVTSEVEPGPVFEPVYEHVAEVPYEGAAEEQPVDGPLPPIEDEDGFQEAFAPAEFVEGGFEEGFDDIMEAEYEVIEDEETPEPACDREVETSSDGGASEDEIVTLDVQDADTDVVSEESLEATTAWQTDSAESAEDGSVPAQGTEVMAPTREPVEDEESVSTPAAPAEDAPSLPDSTVAFDPNADGAASAPADLSGTIAIPVRKLETVDSLMAEISQPAPSRPQRVISVPSTMEAPTPHTPQAANRASLFDLPDPSATPVDPFAVPEAHAGIDQDVQDTGATVPGSVPAVDVPDAVPVPVVEDRFETISAPAPIEEKPRRGIGRLFGRKKKNDDSMSDWLGVDDSFDAKSSGSDIGSWDNFEDDWKGGAAGYDGASEAEMREAITNMGDDELLGHDIWFVATGASENGNAGMRAFLDTHRDKLRGVFLINLESVGAGELAMLATEGEARVLKGDKRIMKLVHQVSSDFHRECATVDMPHVTTDAHVAMGMSLRSLTIGGVEGTGFALSHTEDDQPYNVDVDNVAFVSDVVTEVIRRS